MEALKSEAIRKIWPVHYVFALFDFAAAVPLVFYSFVYFDFKFSGCPGHLLCSLKGFYLHACVFVNTSQGRKFFCTISERNRSRLPT